MKRPLIFGEVLFDCFADGSEVPGGAPFNVAWNLRGLGQDPLFISRVGKDVLGDRILELMGGFGMDASGVQRDPVHSTGTVDVKIVDGEPEFEIVADRAWDFIEPPAIEEIDASVIYHGSLALRNDTSAAAMAWILQAAGGSTPVFFDVNLRPPWWDMTRIRNQLMTANFIKLNEHELDALVPGTLPAKARAGELIDRPGVRNVFLTRGADGATGFTPDGVAVDARSEDDVLVVDTVGAGDAFSSVLIVGILEEWPLRLTLDRAHAFAGAVVGLRGATTIDPDFYARIRATWSVA
jgi:fructokinase